MARKSREAIPCRQTLSATSAVLRSSRKISILRRWSKESGVRGIGKEGPVGASEAISSDGLGVGSMNIKLEDGKK
jgi:hypothetical protein